MQDPQAIKFIVVPYRKVKGGGLRPGDMRQATTSFGAVRVAQAMASNSGIAGVAAYEVLVDKETGAMDSPRVLFQHGAIPALDE